jgi:8-oxo-dGTP diphosphatase
MTQLPEIEISTIVVKEGRVLLGKRKNAQGGYDWGVPRGRLNQDEPIEERALKQLATETGLKALTLHQGPWTHDHEEKTLCLFIFIDLFENEASMTDDFQWFDWNDLPYPLPSSLLKLIQMVGLQKLKEASGFSFSSHFKHPIVNKLFKN